MNALDVGSKATTMEYVSQALNESGLSFMVKLDTNQTGFSCITNISTVLKAYVTADTSINASFKESLGMTMDDMLISCYFNGVACNSSDFIYFRTHDFGNCYTFNGLVTDVKQVSRTGTGTGLIM